MHGLAIIENTIKTILAEVDKINAKEVKEVSIEVGELLFLDEEEINFAWNSLTRDNILKNTNLKVKYKKGKIKCENCGYKGKLAENSHHRIIVCPKCNGKVIAIQGMELVVKNVKMVFGD